MRLRPANLDDLELLRAWDAKAHVLAATGPDADFDWPHELPRDLPWREFLIAEVQDRPVGVMQVIDPQIEETHYWGEIGPNLRAIDIWIGEEADLGRGFGTVMMRLAISRCFADPFVEAILIDPLVANTRAHTFYERLGFARVGRRMFGGDDCFVYRLERHAWQHRSLTSPPVR